MSIKKCPANGMSCTEQCRDWDSCKHLSSAERRVQVPDPWAVKREPQMVYTIMWYYSDKSDSGVVEVAFRRREDAEELRQLLIDHGGTKEFMICQSVLKG